MIRNRSVFILFFFLYCFLQAAEVDSVYAIGKNISDSREVINIHLNREIENILDKLPEDLQSQKCHTVALFIIRELGTNRYLFFTAGSLHTSFEFWIESNVEIDRIPSIDEPLSNYMEESIYGPKLKIFGIKETFLSPTININNVYLGTDKISHFLATGYEYYWKYLKVMESGKSIETAQFEAIKRGLWLENGILGVMSLGIFSYADIEANYQGLLFIRNLCDENILQNISGEWKMNKKVDIRRYVNPNWDETYNPNYYTPSRYHAIQQNIDRLDICNRYSWEDLNTRYRIYENTFDSSRIKDDWLDTSLSASLMHLLQAPPEDQEIIYYDMVKRYNLSWSLKEIIDFFGTKWKTMRPVSFESFCIFSKNK
jgi:hypothetical protein